MAAAAPTPVTAPAAEGAAPHATPESALEELLAATEADASALDSRTVQPDADATASGAAAQRPPAPQGGHGDAGAVDESALSPEVLARLRVLRRLTGGKASDTDLLERIRQERGGQLEASSGKPKRRWW